LAVYPLHGYPISQPPPIFQVFGCGKHGIAFNREETTAYVVDPSYGGLQLADPLRPDMPPGSGDLTLLLSYHDPVEYSENYMQGVFLSPDERTVALYIEDSKGLDEVQERYIEIFALDDLAPGTLRRDVRPLQTIPDATVATFSPNSDYIVTDKGLYSVKFANQTPAVNGTISAFSPNGQLLATYQDGFVTLWRVPQPTPTDLPLAQYEIGGVRELAFSAGGTRLYVIRAGEVQTWGVAD
jgi:WD40 repeat protein